MLQVPTPNLTTTQCGRSAAERRRTFAIISHPDAGKTTLTEKLLLFGDAIQMAAHVKARGERRRTRSDWLQIEQARGISVSSSVMTFEYGVPVKLEPAPYETARWLSSDKPERLRLFCEANRFSIAEDKDSALAFLVRNAWTLDRAIEEWPDIEFLKVRERYGETQS